MSCILGQIICDSTTLLDFTNSPSQNSTQSFLFPLTKLINFLSTANFTVKIYISKRPCFHIAFNKNSFLIMSIPDRRTRPMGHGRMGGTLATTVGGEMCLRLRGPEGLYSLSRKTSYRKISWSFEAARFGFRRFQLLWNLTGTSSATLPRCLSNFRAKRSL